MAFCHVIYNQPNMDFLDPPLMLLAFCVFIVMFSFFFCFVCGCFFGGFFWGLLFLFTLFIYFLGRGGRLEVNSCFVFVLED